LRTEWLDRRLVVNATVYDTEYKDFQVQTIIPNILNSFILTKHSKSAQRAVWNSKAVAQITSGLHAALGYAYTDAHAVGLPGRSVLQRPEHFPATLHGPVLRFQNLDGRDAAKCAEEQGEHRVGLQAKHPLGVPGRRRFHGELGLAERGGFCPLREDPGTLQPSYGITNMNLQFTPQAFSNLSFSVFCNKRVRQALRGPT